MYERTVKLHILPEYDDDLVITQAKSAAFLTNILEEIHCYLLSDVTTSAANTLMQLYDSHPHFWL